jgi:hypothetical protein
MSIHLTSKVAFDLVKQAAVLFHQGTGIVIEPLGDEYMHQDEGFVDELDGDIRHWAHLLLHFARTVHGILNYAMLEQDNLIEND